MDAFLKRSASAPSSSSTGKRARGGRGSVASRLVACPACARQVPLPLINTHLDSAQCRPQPVAATPPLARSLAPPRSPHGEPINQHATGGLATHQNPLCDLSASDMDAHALCGAAQSMERGTAAQVEACTVCASPPVAPEVSTAAAPLGSDIPPASTPSVTPKNQASAKPSGPTKAGQAAAYSGAFATMMDSARQASRVLHCELRRAACAGRLGFFILWSWREPAAASWSSELFQLRLHRAGSPIETRLRLHAGRDVGEPRHPRLLWAGCATMPYATSDRSESSGGCGLTMSQLKSALQKNVRLCRPAAAVRVAWAIASSIDASGKRVGESELLRRLPIIAIEDALPHPHLAVIVWLMAAHAKGLPLSAAHVTLLMEFVYDIAATPWREDVSMARRAFKGAGESWVTGKASSEGPRLADVDDIDPVRGSGPVQTDPRDKRSVSRDNNWSDGGCLNDDQDVLSGAPVLDGSKRARTRIVPGVDDLACLVRALLVREAFGGMKGDMRMLETAATLWMERAVNRPPPRGIAVEGCGSTSEDSAPNDFVAHPESWWNCVEAAYCCSECGGAYRTSLDMSWSATFSNSTPSASPATSHHMKKLPAAQREQDVPASLSALYAAAPVKSSYCSCPKSAERRSLVLGEGIELRPSDIPLSALDFHCSNTLEVALRQPNVRTSLAGALGLAASAICSGAHAGGDNDPFASSAKSAMWKCSSGLSMKLDWEGGRAVDAAIEARTAAMTSPTGATSGVGSRNETGACFAEQLRAARRRLSEQLHALESLVPLQANVDACTAVRFQQSSRRTGEAGCGSDGIDRAISTLNTAPEEERVWAVLQAPVRRAAAALLRTKMPASSLTAPLSTTAHTEAGDIHNTASASSGALDAPVEIPLGQGALRLEAGSSRQYKGEPCAFMPPLRLYPNPGCSLPVPHEILPGQFVLHDFLSPAEEELILDWLDGPDSGPPWQWRNFSGPSYAKRWGVQTDLLNRKVNPDTRMPGMLIALNERMRAAAPDQLAAFLATEANAIDYRRREGHYLGSHVDDRQLSGPLIINLSLAGDSVMTYKHDRSRAPPVRVRLQRRSLQIQSGDVRFSWQHGILNEDLPERRVSITFRQALPTSSTKNP